MSKVCGKCGAILDDSALFCDECGERLGAVENRIIKQDDSKKNSPIGIASLVFGIVSILTGGIFVIPEVLGFIFGIVALKNEEVKHTLPLIGLIMSAVMLVIAIIALILTLVL